MKAIVRSMLVLLIAVFIGLAVYHDPGYVLVAYQHWTVEMPLWLALALIGVTYILLRLVWNLLTWPLQLAHRWGAWRSQRILLQGLQALVDGFQALILQHWYKAEKAFIESEKRLSGEIKRQCGLLYELAHAYVAQHQQNYPDRDRHLQQAKKRYPQASLLTSYVQAKCLFESGDVKSASALLQPCSANTDSPAVLLLLKQCYEVQKEWDKLVQLIPLLEKHVHALSNVWCMNVYKNNLVKHDANLEALQRAWANVPRNYQQNIFLLHTYVELLLKLQQQAKAERVLIQALERYWSSELVLLYSSLTTKSLTARIEQMEHWLAAHPEDATLLRCLAQLCELQQLWGKARSYWQESIVFEPTPNAYLALARLNERLGESTAAVDCLRKGLELLEQHNEVE